MKYTRQARVLLRAAMLMTVLMVVGHIHSHLCLDGQQQALSVHFETFSGHPDHQDEHALEVSGHHHDADATGHHNDVENELIPDGLLANKAPAHAAPVLLLAFSLLFAFQPSARQLDYRRRDELNHTPPIPLFPPSRGPPSQR